MTDFYLLVAVVLLPRTNFSVGGEISTLMSIGLVAAGTVLLLLLAAGAPPPAG